MNDLDPFLTGRAPTFAEQLKALRAETNFPQWKAAQAAKVAKQTIVIWESGKIVPVEKKQRRTLKAIREAYEQSLLPVQPPQVAPEPATGQPGGFVWEFASIDTRLIQGRGTVKLVALPPDRKLPRQGDVAILDDERVVIVDVLLMDPAGDVMGLLTRPFARTNPLPENFTATANEIMEQMVELLLDPAVTQLPATTDTSTRHKMQFKDDMLPNYISTPPPEVSGVVTLPSQATAVIDPPKPKTWFAIPE